jgi:hypothetical protein
MRLRICEEDLEDGFDEEIKNVRALVKTITPALKGGGKESAKQKKRDYILDDFTKSYPVGGKSRDRITARIRSSKRRKDAGKPLINTYGQSTKKALYRNLIYTGLTRAKTLAVFVGTRRAMTMAIHQQDTALRQTALEQLLKGN